MIWSLTISTTRTGALAIRVKGSAAPLTVARFHVPEALATGSVVSLPQASAETRPKARIKRRMEAPRKALRLSDARHVSVTQRAVSLLVEYIRARRPQASTRFRAANPTAASHMRPLPTYRVA